MALDMGGVFKVWGDDVEETNPVLYAANHSIRAHPVLKELAEETQRHPLSIMMTSLDQMQLLQNLVRSIGAKKTIDIGVFTGVSALATALVIPEDGKVHALDITTEFVEIGIPYWKKAGVDNKIKFFEGKALQTLDKFIEDGQSGTFDYAFIDADKTSYDIYYERCLQLVRSGGIIAIDDTLWFGKPLKPEINDPDTCAIRALNEKLHKDERVYISLLVIGDGTTILFKK